MSLPPSDPSKKGCSRREFLVTAIATGLLGCSRSTPLRVRGFQGLADLPYFKLDSNGLLRVTVRDLPPIIDMHAHLRFSYMFAPRLDYLRRTPRTHYVLDLDRTGSTLDLDEYVNRSAPEELLHEDENARPRGRGGLERVSTGLTTWSPTACCGHGCSSIKICRPHVILAETLPNLSIKEYLSEPGIKRWTEDRRPKPDD